MISDYHNEKQWELNRKEYKRTGKVRCHCCGGFLNDKKVKSEIEAFGKIHFEEVECQDCLNPYIGLNRLVSRKDFSEYRSEFAKYDRSEEEYYVAVDELIEITNSRNKYLNS